MQQLIKPTLSLAVMILSLVLAQNVAAHSHEGPGDHVQTFDQNLDSYAADVEKLADILDGVAGEYAAERDVQAPIKNFIDVWEVAECHEAIETVAIPLYPPIWVAISAMQQAAQEKASIKDFVAAVNAVKASLNEGMGGVRLAAAQRTQGIESTINRAAVEGAEEGHEKLDSKAEIKAIKDALDNAVAKYGEGDAEAAKALIQDAYLHRFEGLEGGLIAQDAELVSVLEREFNVDLTVLINSSKPKEDVAAMVEQMKARLDQAAELLANADKKKSKVF